MESCGHHFSLPDGDWIAALGRDYFDSRADAFNLGGADENHFERIATQSAFADGAVVRKHCDGSGCRELLIQIVLGSRLRWLVELLPRKCRRLASPERTALAFRIPLRRAV